jgi:hypothetical protein
MSEEGGIPPTPPAPPESETMHEPPEPPSGPTNRPGNPWEQREQLGFVQGLIEGVRAFVAAPGDTFSKTMKSGDVASPLIFTVVLSTTMALVGQIWGLMFGASLLSILPLPPEAEGMLGWMAATSGFSIAAVFIVTPNFTVK